jgi:GNAT superfamily N-acetyltransferase
MNPTRQPPIVQELAGQAPNAADLIAQAFEHLAVAAYLVPKPERRWQVLRDNFHIFVDHAINHGHIYMTEDRAAVAVWFPRPAPLPPPSDYEQRLTEACGEDAYRFRLLDKVFDAHHPNIPHHHLAFLAVHNTRQGQGLGTALLRHHHDVLDQIGLPAYLEASSPRSRNLYTRHTYHAAAPFYLPDGPPFWPMWREPQARPRQTTGGESADPTQWAC